MLALPPLMPLSVYILYVTMTCCMAERVRQLVTALSLLTVHMPALHADSHQWFCVGFLTLKNASLMTEGQMQCKRWVWLSLFCLCLPPEDMVSWDSLNNIHTRCASCVMSSSSPLLELTFHLKVFVPVVGSTKKKKEKLATNVQSSRIRK